MTQRVERSGLQVDAALAQFIDGDVLAPLGMDAGAFWQGFVTHLSNPKAVLYWTALLPQFVDATRPIAAQTVTLGLIGISIDMVTLAGYGLTAAATRRLGLTQRYTRWVDVAAGAFFTIAGALLAFAHR